MQTRTQYIILKPLDEDTPTVPSLAQRLCDLGMAREAYYIKEEVDGKVSLEFWEPNRTEALRYLEALESRHGRH